MLEFSTELGIPWHESVPRAQKFSHWPRTLSLSFFFFWLGHYLQVKYLYPVIVIVWMCVWQINSKHLSDLSFYNCFGIVHFVLKQEPRQLKIKRASWCLRDVRVMSRAGIRLRLNKYLLNWVWVLIRESSLYVIALLLLSVLVKIRNVQRKERRPWYEDTECWMPTPLTS